MAFSGLNSAQIVSLLGSARNTELVASLLGTTSGSCAPRTLDEVPNTAANAALREPCPTAHDQANSSPLFQDPAALARQLGLAGLLGEPRENQPTAAKSPSYGAAFAWLHQQHELRLQIEIQKRVSLLALLNNNGPPTRTSFAMQASNVSNLDIGRQGVATFPLQALPSPLLQGADAAKERPDLAMLSAAGRNVQAGRPTMFQPTGHVLQPFHQQPQNSSRVLGSRSNHSQRAKMPAVPPAASFATSGAAPKRAGRIGSFPVKLHRMLAELKAQGRDDIASFLPGGRLFCVHKPAVFVEVVMSKYFKNMTRFSSFQRQLNLYNFVRVSEDTPEKGAYYHELFTEGDGLKALSMKRSKLKGTLTNTGNKNAARKPSPEQGPSPLQGNRESSHEKTDGKIAPDNIMISRSSSSDEDDYDADEEENDGEMNS
jgi:HSF-type DNA-binding